MHTYLLGAWRHTPHPFAAQRLRSAALSGLFMADARRRYYQAHDPAGFTDGQSAGLRACFPHDAERTSAESVFAQLCGAAIMFKFDLAAQCTLSGVELTSAALKLGTPDPAEAQDGHADLNGSFGFNCADATKAPYVDHAASM